MCGVRGGQVLRFDWRTSERGCPKERGQCGVHSLKVVPYPKVLNPLNRGFGFWGKQIIG